MITKWKTQGQKSKKKTTTRVPKPQEEITNRIEVLTIKTYSFS